MIADTTWTEEVIDAVDELPDEQRSRATQLVAKAWNLAQQCVKNISSPGFAQINEQFDATIAELATVDDGFIAFCIKDEILDKVITPLNNPATNRY